MASAERAFPGFEALVDRAMAGHPLDHIVVAPSEPHGPTETPTDPIALLGKPVPSVDPAKDPGVELSQKQGMVTTVFIKRGAIGNGLRPGGLDTFALTRTSAARRAR